ncbi:MAG: MMPL family transporter [Armatimonadia bacterium]|nr:MMPL family transporter [Armatimonadia bacterium]
MWLTHVAIRRPVAMSMLFVALAILGLQSWGKLPKQLFPDVEIPVMTVRTIYPGAGPEEVERLIVEPIEEAVSTINRVDDVRGTSTEGLGLVIVAFEPDTDEDAAASDVRDKVFGVLNQLPDDAETPVVEKFDFTAQPTVIIGATSEDLSTRELRSVADRTIKDRISGAIGVASVAVGGGEVREIQIKAKQDRLTAIGMSLTDFQRWLTAQSLDLPGGSFKEGEKEYSVRVLGEFDTVDEIRDLTLRTADGGLIQLDDVAEVRDTVQEPETLARLNGEPSVSFTVTKTSNANIIESVEAVKERVDALRESLPGDIAFTYVADESKFTEESLYDLTTSLIYGVGLATLVVYFFLRNVRATIIIFFAIPTSLLSTFFVMRIIGYTLNFMTMLGLALAIGILVDDSIVVLENIYRHLAMGKDPKTAAIDGREEIGLAAVAITMVDVVVFIPIALMGGIVGKFFRPFGATVAVSTLFSLLVSFTLTPMLAARWLRPGDAGHEDEEDRGIAAVQARGPYVRFVDFCVRSWYGRLAAILGGVVIIAGMLFIAGRDMGGSFFRDADQGEFNVFVELPTEKNIDATDRIVRQVEGIVAQIPEVRDYSTQVGRMADRRGPNYAQVAIKCLDLAPKGRRTLARYGGETLIDNGDSETGKLRVRGVRELMAEIQKKCDQQITGASVRVRMPSGGGGGAVNPLSVEIMGSRDAGLIEKAREVHARLSEEEGFDAIISYQPGKPEIQAHIDRIRAAELGFSVAEIASAVRTAVEGDTSLEYRELGNEYDIRVEFADVHTDATTRIPDMVIGTHQGTPVRLSEVARVEEGVGPAELTRLNRLDLVTVGIEASDLTTGEASQRIDEILQEIHFPPGITYRLGGTAEQMRESFGYMIEALQISVILVFALLTMLFESLVHPFTIMTCAPMAIAGAIVGLRVAGCILDIFAMIGIIMLIGLVTKNSILLVDYTNTLREQGLNRTDALVRSGVTRLRPIVMTTLTLVLSLLPISTGLGRGAEFRQPLGASVTGGILFAMFLTLLIVPAFYCWMDDIGRGYGWLKRTLTGAGRRQAPDSTSEGEGGGGSETGSGVGEGD